MSFNPVHNAAFNYISWASVDLTGSLAEDGYIKFEPSEDLTEVSQDVGSKNTSISVINNNTGLITVQLEAQSPANIALANIVRQEKITGKKIISNFSITARGSNYIYEPIGCHIHKRPPQDFSKSMAGKTLEWVFHCADLREKELNDSIFVGIDVTSNVGNDILTTIEAQVQATIEL